MDLIIQNARLAEGPADNLIDIGVAGGRIVAIGPHLGDAGETYDAAGRLVCGGLVETHIHLDKSRIIDRCPLPEGRRVNPVTLVAPLKPAMTVEDMHARAAATLRECLVNGTTRMRTQVEIDPGIGMRGYEAIAALAAEYRWAIDLEICVFPQEGLTNYPGTAQVLGGARRYWAAHRATTAPPPGRSSVSLPSPANTTSSSTCISMSATAPSTWTSTRYWS